MPLQWERIDSINRPLPNVPNLGQWIAADRARVQGGWLVRTYAVVREVVEVPGIPVESELAFGVGLAFVPDPAGTWRA